MDLTEADLDRLADRVSGHRVTRNGDGGFRKLIDGLLIIGVAALVAVVWNLSNNVSVLTAQVTYMNQEISALRAKVP
jgi:hypothetical protein